MILYVQLKKVYSVFRSSLSLRKNQRLSLLKELIFVIFLLFILWLSARCLCVHLCPPTFVLVGSVGNRYLSREVSHCFPLIMNSRQQQANIIV